MEESTRRLKIEAVAGIASAVLLVVTLVSRDWIEIVFRVDPDRGSGWLEWAIVGATGASALAFAVLAGIEWRTARLSTT